MRSRYLAVLAVSALTCVGAAALVGTGSSITHLAGAAAPSGSSGPVDRTSTAGAIRAAQLRLDRVPADDRTWAQLGAAYVQQGRITADPTFYPKAEGALARSLRLRPEGNVDAYVGEGALANARHEFAEAVRWGRRAASADPYDAAALGVLTDAYTQLGRFDDADSALQRMLDLQPGLSSFSRASYAFEQRGDVPAARAALTRALAEAVDPADVAFCRYYLGQLDFTTGAPAAALEQYRLGLLAQPGAPMLVAGRAAAAAAAGRTDEALRDYADVTARLPLPEYLLEYAQLLVSLGRDADADALYVVLAGEQQLFAANGVQDDLTAAVVEADHGDPADAVRHARLEWDRRQHPLVADALAWALHRAGRDAEAREFADRAAGTGWRNAIFAYHRGMIEKSLGHDDSARRELTRALDINPYFSPTQAPVARRALAELGGHP
ncbi:hypothetical protein ACIB24_15150 [Spongisporangium articulatum]|uniref:Tetratricopeptide repeat protein n=1 Tax=Spongisporangium articulatum TaxID=3362603 RepID=A0ABW8APU3_9ACTN